MTSRWFTLTLVALLLLIQYPLWIGKGGWIRGWELDRKRQEAIGHSTRLEQRNAALDGEVRDLKQGLLAIEERARYELGMIRSDEVFVHVTDPKAAYKSSVK
jgi:cell division protein FtsB